MTTRYPVSTSGSRAVRSRSALRRSRVWSVTRPAGSRLSSGSTLGWSRSCTLSRSWSSTSARPSCSTARLPAAGSPSVRTSTTRWPALANDSASASDTKWSDRPTPTGATATTAGSGMLVEHLGTQPAHRRLELLATSRGKVTVHPAPVAGRRASTGRPVADDLGGRAHLAGPAFEQQRDQAPEREPGERARGEHQERSDGPGAGAARRGGDHGAGRGFAVLQCGALRAKAHQLVAQRVGQLAVEHALGRAAELGRRGRRAQVVDHSQGLVLETLDPGIGHIAEPSLTVGEVGGGDRIHDSLGDDRVARREGDLQDLRVGRDVDTHPTLQPLQCLARDQHGAQHLRRPGDLGLGRQTRLLVLSDRGGRRRERVAGRRVHQDARGAGVRRRHRAAVQPARQGPGDQRQDDDGQVVAHGPGEGAPQGSVDAQATWRSSSSRVMDWWSSRRRRSRLAPRSTPQSRPTIAPEVIGTSAFAWSALVAASACPQHVCGLVFRPARAPPGRRGARESGRTARPARRSRAVCSARGPAAPPGR